MFLQSLECGLNLPSVQVRAFWYLLTEQTYAGVVLTYV
jgi:hypothetical protein